ncbi:Hypothetical predicted protein [Cloeon dipterum]|uniref:EF-hand domain-containing protein n=1 Tax=Cloeon dipterum TaxID=197152 RepID=A0A8S1DTP8_9INSE|nr:Hypothetical predicted protein [Cloeon dipterum]
MSTENELSSVLSRRQAINDALDGGVEVKPRFRAATSIYTEFHEFTRKQIKQYETEFNKYDEGGDGFLDLTELKLMMERLGAPQTHLGLKSMIAEVDEDKDNKISFREFLLIFRKASAGELSDDSGLSQLARLTEICVHEVGVVGAKSFFEAKIRKEIEEQNKGSKFEQELREEQEGRRREEEERARRRQAFKQTASVFQ